MGALNFGIAGSLVSEDVNDGSRADGLVVRLRPDGQPLWARSFGDLEAQMVDTVAVDGQGAIIIGGWFSGELELGGPPLRGTSMNGVGFENFLAKLSPEGEPLWGQKISEPQGWPFPIAVDSNSKHQYLD